MGSTAVAEPETEDAQEEAEAANPSSRLFQYSMYVHAGEGAEECEHAIDGKCKEAEHFHAWIRMPNSLQHRDIVEKGKAAAARRKRAMRDAGTPADGSTPARPPADAYVMLESELDDLMAGDREAVLESIARRNERKRFSEYVADVREGDERFETYFQDAEEYRRQLALPEDQRGEDFQELDDLMTAFGEAVEARVSEEREREMDSLRSVDDEVIRTTLRESRIEGEANEHRVHAYYLWLGFVSTYTCAGSRRYFGSLEEFRNAAPEAVDAIDGALKDLETRMTRGEASGN